MTEENGSDIELSPLLESLSAAYAEDPTSKKFLPLAEEYRKSNMYDEAIYFCKEGLKQHPHYTPALLTLARCYIDVKEYGEAMAALNTILERQPDNPSAHRMIGDLYRRRGDFDNAREHYEIVLKTRPGDVEVQTRLRDMSGGGTDGEEGRTAINVSSLDGTSDVLVSGRTSGTAEKGPYLGGPLDPDKFKGEEEALLSPKDEVPDLDLDEDLGGDDIELTLAVEDKGVLLSLDSVRPVEIVSREPGGEEKPLAPAPEEPEGEAEEELNIEEIKSLEIGGVDDVDEMPPIEVDTKETESAEEGEEIEIGDIDLGIEGLETGETSEDTTAIFGAEPIGGRVTSIGTDDSFDEEEELPSLEIVEERQSSGDGRDVLSFREEEETPSAKLDLEEEETEIEGLEISAEGLDTEGVEATIERAEYNYSAESLGDSGEHIVIETGEEELAEQAAAQESAMEQNVIRAEVIELDDLSLDELAVFPDEELFLERGQVIAESVSMGQLEVETAEEVVEEREAPKEAAEEVTAEEKDADMEFELGDDFVLEGVEEELKSTAVAVGEAETSTEEEIEVLEEPEEEIAEVTEIELPAEEEEAEEIEPLVAEEPVAESQVGAEEDVAPPTRTTARIYEQQGHYEEALKVYRQLLTRNPGDDELRAKIEELESRSPEPVVSDDSATVGVLNRWLHNIEAFKKKISRG